MYAQMHDILAHATHIALLDLNINVRILPDSLSFWLKWFLNMYQTEGFKI